METLNWTLTTGCENLGGGCESCPSMLEYKEKGWDYSIKMHPEELITPFILKEPKAFMVSFGSDLFHEGVSDEFIYEAFDVMRLSPQHTFEVITKRTERLKQMAPSLPWTGNIWIGTTVESRDVIGRIKDLQTVPAENKYLSFVPLLGDVGEVDLSGIKIASVQPETWGDHRPCEQSWIDNIEGQCDDQGVALTENFNLYQEA